VRREDKEIKCRQFKTFYRVLGVGSNEDTNRNTHHEAAEFQSAKAGQVDIQQHDLYLARVEIFEGFFGGGVNPRYIQEREFSGKGDRGQPVNFIIVNDDTAIWGIDYIHFRNEYNKEISYTNRRNSVPFPGVVDTVIKQAMALDRSRTKCNPRPAFKLEGSDSL